MLIRFMLIKKECSSYQLLLTIEIHIKKNCFQTLLLQFNETFHGFDLEMLQRHGDLGQTTQFTLQSPKGLKIAFVPLQSKTTQYADQSLPGFICIEQNFMKVKTADCKGHVNVFPEYLQSTAFKLIRQIQRMHYYYNPSSGKNIRQVHTITPPKQNEIPLCPRAPFFRKSILITKNGGGTMTSNVTSFQLHSLHREA